MTRLILTFGLLFSLAACAGQNRFVLLEEEDGSVGAITVENAAGSQTVTEAGDATQVASATAAPSEPQALSEAEIQQTWGASLQASPLKPRSFLLYFVFGTDVLTEESRTQLPAILDSLREYPAPEVAVIGHTDRVGPAAVNERLARDRAEAMRALLLQEGLDPNLMTVSSHGEANPLVPTADEVPEPQNRRVEVMVR
ncbi:OmpA family protein [Pelagibius sp. 7325]|uniref:OmpA family protein n=1 Tax=Pelagibius sp. 7325 TaxID=3131994 RepID=UPI0030EF982A